MTRHGRRCHSYCTPASTCDLSSARPSSSACSKYACGRSARAVIGYGSPREDTVYGAKRVISHEFRNAEVMYRIPRASPVASVSRRQGFVAEGVPRHGVLLWQNVQVPVVLGDRQSLRQSISARRIAMKGSDNSTALRCAWRALITADQCPPAGGACPTQVRAFGDGKWPGASWRRSSKTDWIQWDASRERCWR